jgi:hypothetical protein|tara:strand:- start:8713 stop:9063 length:351 start_codon:yes stop_codon:yes gene_type:complete
MGHTTTVIQNHKGLTGSKVAGEEYLVDANINIESYTEDGEIITAAELGLSSLHAVLITGQETAGNVALQNFVVELDVTGNYETSASFTLVGTIGSSGLESPNSDLGYVRVRVYGNL